MYNKRKKPSSRDAGQCNSGLPTVQRGRTPGLYDHTGRSLLAKLSRSPNATVKVQKQSFTINMEDHDQKLVLARVTSADNCDRRCRAKLGQRAHEYAARKEDLSITRKQALDKMMEVALSHDDEPERKDLLGELEVLLVLQGHQQEAVALLKPTVDVEVEYTKERVSETVVLPLGQLCRLPFFAQPVLFLHGPLPTMEVVRVEHSIDCTTSLDKWNRCRANDIIGIFERSFGSLGAGDGQFDGPGAVAVENDELFVNDTSNYRIVVHKLNGTFVRAVGAKDRDLGLPICLTVVGDRLFVADIYNNRVLVMQRGGTFLFSFGGKGAGNGQFDSPVGVAVHGDRIYVADSLNHRISVHQLDGTFVSAFGVEGAGDGQFTRPSGITIAKERVLVVDRGNHRICVHHLDGTFDRLFGSKGNGDGQFDEPRSTAVAGDRVFVTDSHNHRVCVHKFNGTFVRAFGSEGVGDGQFRYPTGVAVVGPDLFVADCNNDRICVFK